MSGNFRIRGARKSDLAALLKLDTRAYGEGGGYSPLVLRQHLDATPEYFLVAERDGALLGYILAQPMLDSRTVWLHSLAANLDISRHGAILALIIALHKILIERGVQQVLLTARPDNDPIRHMVEKYGAKIIGEEPDYYGPDTRRLLCRIDVPPLKKEAP